MSEIFQIKDNAYREIEERFACDHPDREIRRRIIADDRVSYVLQCVDCGRTSTPISKKVALAHNPDLPPYDPHLQEQFYRKKHQEYLRTYRDIRPDLKTEYAVYLNSPEWRARREAALDRSFGLCEICEDIATEVHHLTYQNIGAELPEELISVCRECHESIHGRTAMGDSNHSQGCA